ncbi:uncharacterized protein LOC122084755 [Macadamia integrifolia]|uniref:uncharacterized protein LOC122084755 n=1 Tax=Macadamia integrifolia TaxID=60698 RepID=UPI001C4FE5B2|nr:uncharacterized protein LOC122084755 [Macadamia integrifolia]
MDFGYDDDDDDVADLHNVADYDDDGFEDGFVKGCRLLIGVDDCHLKGRYGGILLSVVSYDGNNEIFPVAYAVVEVEYKDNWIFFLECLHKALGTSSDDMALTLMFDKQKGLLDAISRVFPYAHQSYPVSGPSTSDMKTSLDKVQQKARECIMHQANSHSFEVVDMRGGKVVVNLSVNTCGCRLWDCTRLPCKHAAGAITHNKESLQAYCSSYYSVNMDLKAYNEFIEPLPALADLMIDTNFEIVQPPLLKRRPGRPRKSRKRKFDEGPAKNKSSSLRCDICNILDHKRRTCPRSDEQSKKNNKTGKKQGDEIQHECSNSQVLTRSQATYQPTQQTIQDRALAQHAIKNLKWRTKYVKKK